MRCRMPAARRVACKTDRALVQAGARALGRRARSGGDPRASHKALEVSVMELGCAAAVFGRQGVGCAGVSGIQEAAPQVGREGGGGGGAALTPAAGVA